MLRICQKLDGVCLWPEHTSSKLAPLNRIDKFNRKFDIVKPPNYSYKWFPSSHWSSMKLMFLYELLETLGYQFIFVFLNHRWWFYSGATGMSPLGGGTGRTPRPTWAKTKHCFVCSARFGNPYESEASPTQSYLNFECKVWHCKLFIIK